MAVQKILKLTTDGYEEFSPIQSTTGVGDAGKPVATSDNGRLDESLMPNGIGADIQVAPAYENLSAGDYINLFMDTDQTLKARKADASFGFAKQAHGFVKEAVNLGANASVYTNGFNSNLTGLVKGTYYYLSSVDAGKIVTGLPTEGSGHIRQKLGMAVNPTTLLTKITEPIKRG